MGKGTKISLLLLSIAVMSVLPAKAERKPIAKATAEDQQKGDTTKQIGLNYTKGDKSVDITLSGVPLNSRIFTTKITDGYEILIPVDEEIDEYKLPSIRRIQTGNVPLEFVELSRDIDKFRLRFRTASTSPPSISRENRRFIFSILNNDSSTRRISKSIYESSGQPAPYVPNYTSPSAPPVGRIVSGTVVVPNPSRVKLEGPTINLNIRNLSAYTVLNYIAKRGDYDIVFVKSDPTYVNPSASPSTINSTSTLSSLSSGLTNGMGPTSMQTNQQSQGTSGSNQGGSQSTLDNPRLITLSLREKPYSQAFNSVLTASGLQASFREGIIFVGPDIIQKSIGERISKTFRLNQISAQSAAQFLGNLGASMTYTNTITTAVSSGISSQAAVSSASTATTTQSSTSAQVLTYGSSTGPLLGLNGTTDDRLSQITLIGDPQLVNLASNFLKRLDLRSRQVALSIKIYDVDLTNNDELSNQLSYTDGKAIITSDPANSNIGVVLNPDDGSRGTPGVGQNPFTTTNGEAPVIGSAGDTVTAASGLYAEGRDDIVYNTFRALTTSKASKLLASPTIILMEENSSSGSGSGSSGNSPNQGSLFVGENVITGLEPVENSTACRQTFSQVGLNVKATLNKIDDNGFVTFKIEPTLTAPDSTVAIPGCGQQTIVTTSERRFESGVSRVRDGQTLILTGVISDRESSTNTKVPILGDLPILGTLFRSSSTDRKKKELVLTVTPRVLKDENTDSYGYYQPKTTSIRSSLAP